MQDSMDLKHSDTLDSVADSYLPNSKSTDLIKPSKSENQPPSGEEHEEIKSSRCFMSNEREEIIWAVSEVKPETTAF